MICDVKLRYRGQLETLKQNKEVIFISRTPINFLLVNLAFADIMVALFIAPQFVLIHTFQHPNGVIGTFLCKFLTGRKVILD